jgi:ATP-dependent DNA helicase RecG
MLKINHPSKPTNRLIADICYKAGLVESWGKGTLKIFEEFKLRSLPAPELLEYAGGFQLIFRNTGDKPAISGDKPAISNTKFQIVELLRLQREMSLSTILDSLPGVTSASWVRELLTELVDENKVIAIGKNKGRKYKIKN